MVARRELPVGARQKRVRAYLERDCYAHAPRQAAARGLLAALQREVERRPAPSRVPKGFVLVPAGRFTMGSPGNEPGREDDECRHEVVITLPFLLQSSEVTQGQWKRLMGTNPSHFSSCGERCPVEQVNWWEALAYCNAASRAERLQECYELQGCDGKKPGEDMECKEARFVGLGCAGYRLPTEAEWEYAARAGTRAALYTGRLTIRGAHDGPELDPIAWYSGNSGVEYSGGHDCSGWEKKRRPSDRCGTHPVGRKQRNRWGLHDMLGNVWEWCWDWYGDYPAGRESAPLGAQTGSSRVSRGGSWYNFARYARSANRYMVGPGYRSLFLGFRPARSIPGP